MTTPPSTVPAGWMRDPSGRFELRYWNGVEWTDHVHSHGRQSVDPLGSRPAPVAGGGAAGATPRASTAPAEAAPQQVADAREPAKVPFFGARKAATRLQDDLEAVRGENGRLQSLIDSHGLRRPEELQRAIRDAEASLAAVKEAIAAADSEAAAAGARVRTADRERQQVEQSIIDLRGRIELQSFGLYDYENPAENSVTLATELESLRSAIKQAIREGQATSASQQFTFNNSAAKGQKFVRDMSKLMLRSYNAEAENCIKSVRAGNLATAQKRLSTTVDQIARLGELIDLRITPHYHRMRLRELEFASRHLQALQREKEEERARREELREQRKAEQELAREKERLDKERTHYANALAALEAKGDVEGVERLRDKLADVDRAISDVDYRSANIRAGYVYVISNIGAFGPEVVKIGMTRRLEPMDRVNELGDASVPFRFDVHAMFFANDAVSVESMLHQHFGQQRINKVNLRREYFRTTPQEVLDVLRAHDVEVLEFNVEPEAPEYRSSVSAS